MGSMLIESIGPVLALSASAIRGLSGIVYILSRLLRSSNRGLLRSPAGQGLKARSKHIAPAEYQ
jgi:hypothetical protein